jgi:hypothetical protein
MTTALEEGKVVSSTPRPYFTAGKDPVPVVQEAGWAPGPVWAGAENLAPTGIRSPGRPARIFFYILKLNCYAIDKHVITVCLH